MLIRLLCILAVSLCTIIIIHHPAQAEELNCAADDKTCLLTALSNMTKEIEETAWRDQTYRELAKLYAREKNIDSAAALVALIENADTKAMTIRGIGMAAAQTDMKADELTESFTKLRAEAEKIEHPPSYAIALTYIAMAQAFAKDDAGAMKTAADMENDSLRNKAYGESAEIQAERGDLQAALASIAAIDSIAYRNKAHKTISKIFADDQRYEEALNAAMKIENDYQKAQSVLYVLSRQISPEEISIGND